MRFRRSTLNDETSAAVWQCGHSPMYPDGKGFLVVFPTSTSLCLPARKWGVGLALEVSATTIGITGFGFAFGATTASFLFLRACLVGQPFGQHSSEDSLPEASEHWTHTK